MRRFVWSRNLVNVDALTHWGGLSRQKQTIFLTTQNTKKLKISYWKTEKFNMEIWPSWTVSLWQFWSAEGVAVNRNVGDANPEVSKRLFAYIPVCTGHRGMRAMEYGVHSPSHRSWNYYPHFYKRPESGLCLYRQKTRSGISNGWQMTPCLNNL